MGTINVVVVVVVAFGEDKVNVTAIGYVPAAVLGTIIGFANVGVLATIAGIITTTTNACVTAVVRGRAWGISMATVIVTASTGGFGLVITIVAARNLVVVTDTADVVTTVIDGVFVLDIASDCTTIFVIVNAMVIVSANPPSSDIVTVPVKVNFTGFATISSSIISNATASVNAIIIIKVIHATDIAMVTVSPIGGGPAATTRKQC